MGIPFFDFTKIPLQKQETNQTFGNLLSNAFEGYQGGQQFKEEQKKRVLSNEEKALANAISKKYDEEMAKAKLSYLQTQAPQAQQNIEKSKMENAILRETGLPESRADLLFRESRAKRESEPQDEVMRLIEKRRDAVDRFGEDSQQVGTIDDYLEKITTNQIRRGGISESLRRFTSLTPSQKENTMARYRPAYNDLEISQNLADGWTDEDFVKGAKERGVDLETAEPVYAATTPNITAQQKRSVVAAGNKVLNKFITEGNQRYVSKINNFSPTQVWESFRKNPEDIENLSKFYAARMLEDEGVVQQLVKTGGNVNVHAVERMLEKGLGNTKVIPYQMREDIYVKARELVDVISEEMMAAERHALSPKREVQVKKEALEKHEKKDISKFTPEQLREMRKNAQ